jgi:hypothetical protein
MDAIFLDHLRKLFRENGRYPCGGQRIGGTPHEQTALQSQIEAADRQIDALVYELYALTEQEIGIVKGGGSRA